MHTWHWRTWNNLPYLTCSLLNSWTHGFFTQQYAPRLPEELTTVLHPTASAYRVKQVHGNIVQTPSEIEAFVGDNLSTNDERPAADGVVSEQSSQSVWVCSADCTPVLIADSATGQVAAVHAGWRGTALKIVPQAIVRMQQRGSRIQDLRVVLGPAISGEVYQVSTTVAAEVGATIASIDSANEPEAIAQLLELPVPVVMPDSEPGRVRLDVRRVNALQLEQLGLSSEQVAISPHCTYQDPDNFFSYRRSKQKKAQWSGIVSQ